MQAGRREERKAQNKAKLLAAARRVFAEKGYGEATARDIVRATDLATGTFYNYFRDKEEVFAALLEEFQQRVREATLEDRRDSSIPLAERIERGALAYFQVVAEDAELFRVLRRNVGAVPMLPIESFFAEEMAAFAEDVEQWNRLGEVDVDPGYLTAFIAGAAFQVANRMVERDPPSPEEAARFLSRALNAAIQALTSDSAAVAR